MTDVEIAQISALARCTFSPGSSAKSFVIRLAGYAAVDASALTDPAIRDSVNVRRFTNARELSEKETAFLDKLAHQYRKQLGKCMSVACMACLPPAPTDVDEIKVALDAVLDDRPDARAAFADKYERHVPDWIRSARALYNKRNGSTFAHLYEYATSCAPLSRRASTRGDVYCRICGERLFAQVKQPHKLVAESPEAQKHLTTCALQMLAGMREPAKPGHRALPLEPVWAEDGPLFGGMESKP